MAEHAAPHSPEMQSPEMNDGETRPEDKAADEHGKSTDAPARLGMADLPDNVTRLPLADRRNQLRMLEALLFASADLVEPAALGERLPEGADISSLLEELQTVYANRGVNLVSIDGRWGFRTADDLSFLLRRDQVEQKRLSRAALETLSIIAYHQPVTRAEIEEIRGVAASKGTLDMLLELGWVRMRGRRRTPGRPVTYGTTDAFLDHFAIDGLSDLPGLSDLKGAGLLTANLPPDFTVPDPGLAEGEDDDLDAIFEDDMADALFGLAEEPGAPDAPDAPEAATPDSDSDGGDLDDCGTDDAPGKAGR